MPAERFVVLGVAQVRSPWFREVARWSTSAMLPVEFVKAMSVEEVRVRLRSGRGYSALLVDDSLSGVDRDLVELARDAGCAVVVVDSGRGMRPWRELGASAVLTSTFERDELVAITGAPGAGRSTVTAALAQGLASDPRHRDMVCLADLALDAEQAMLHGSPDVVPGVLELVDGHRSGLPSIDDVRGMTWSVPARGYHLLLGLRRHRDWTAVRPRAFAAALDGLRRSFRIVVADVDADVEGEQATGSLDVEERNAIARTTLSAADLVVIVGQPGLKGMHSLLRATRGVLAHGVPGGRVLPLINRAPKGPRARAELTSTFGALLAGDGDDVPSPLPVPERRHLDQVHRDGARFPESWLAPVVTSVQSLLDRVGSPEVDEVPTDLEPVRPGALGSWVVEEA
jgi:energy-coupling factor transporter ATP-binding protein EcfA2